MSAISSFSYCCLPPVFKPRSPALCIVQEGVCICGSGAGKICSDADYAKYVLCGSPSCAPRRDTTRCHHLSGSALLAVERLPTRSSTQQCQQYGGFDAMSTKPDTTTADFSSPTCAAIPVPSITIYRRRQYRHLLSPLQQELSIAQRQRSGYRSGRGQPRFVTAGTQWVHGSFEPWLARLPSRVGVGFDPMSPAMIVSLMASQSSTRA